ncbi:MAG: hypothetical protein CO167_09025, partial [Candidatus Marinimicrobia bacterium CG_4_9_14_3_um_filter_48_9]
MGKRIATILAGLLFTAGLFGQVPANWTVGTSAVTVAEETGSFSEGAKSLSATWTSTSNQDVMSDAFAVTEGASYTVDIDVMDNDPAGRTTVAIIWTGGPSNTYSNVFSVDNAEWQTLNYSNTVPAGATHAAILLRLYDVSAGWSGTATNFID